MSMDFDVVCHTCKVKAHMGQKMGGSMAFSVGYGSNDEEGRKEVGQFLYDHEHERGELVIINADNSPEEYRDVSSP